MYIKHVLIHEFVRARSSDRPIWIPSITSVIKYSLVIDCMLIIDRIHDNYIRMCRFIEFSHGWKQTENQPFTHALKSMRLPLSSSYAKYIYIHLRFSTSIVYFYTYFCLIELKWKERQWKSLSERATYNRKKKKMVKNAHTKSISSSSNSDGRNHRRFGIYDIGCINSQKWITNRW